MLPDDISDATWLCFAAKQTIERYCEKFGKAKFFFDHSLLYKSRSVTLMVNNHLCELNLLVDKCTHYVWDPI